MRSQCSVLSAVLNGVEALPVTVEVVISDGMPGMQIVGMGDKAVQEAKERVKAAVKAAGYTIPYNKILVNLAPGNLRKSGSTFDLPIAMGILVATNQVPKEMIKDKLFIGELSLEGKVRQSLGIFAYGLCARTLGVGLVSCGDQYVPIDGLPQFAIRNLSSFHCEDPYQDVRANAHTVAASLAGSSPDYKDIAGHEVAKRALQIAAAGKHGLLMVGTPGSGKTMLASRLVSILPPLEEEEKLETALVHSVVGESIEPVMAGVRPFRSPHHTISTPGLLGGGSPVRPGEISLANNGVLFLDELPEFKSSSLQGLRQPIETGHVNIIRADANIRFPARFSLLAAANPCPCGYFGDKEHPCKCSERQVSKYQSKIGGPLIDRIDMQIDVKRLPSKRVLDSGSGQDSRTLRDGVMKALEFARWRRSKDIEAHTRRDKANATIKESSSPEEIITLCEMDDDARAFIEVTAESMRLSGRGLMNTLKVARTIADIEEREQVSADHLAEAIGLRLRDGVGK